MPNDTLLACLVRAHNRPALLGAVLSELERYQSFPGLKVRTIVLADRPTRAVIDVIARHNVSNYASPVPILGSGRERFLEAQNAHLTFMEAECNPDWVFVSDDDFIIEPGKADLLPGLLSNPDVDAYYMPVLFVQDSPTTYNPDRHHESIRLYRHIPRVRFTGKRMLSVPDGIHDAAVISGRTARFPANLLEYGGYTEADRLANIAAYKAAGKDDDFTCALRSPFRLPLPCVGLNIEKILRTGATPTPGTVLTVASNAEGSVEKSSS